MDLISNEPGGPGIEAFVAFAAGANPFELLAAATKAVVTLFGDRGSCVLMHERPRIIFSTAEPPGGDRLFELERYPEIDAARGTGILVVENVHSAPVMASVRESLPRALNSVTVISLAIGGHTRGAFLIQSDTPHPRSPEAQEEALLVAKLTAVLVQARTAGRWELVQRPERPSAATSGADRAARAGSGTGRTVLIVDDDPDQAEALQAALAAEGYSVRTAANGAAGLTSVRQSPPDMVLMDVSMPVLDGTSAALQMRQDPLSREIPIIFVSGCPDLLPRIRDLAIENMDFLQKPYVFDQLLLRVQRAIQRTGTQRRLREDANIDELTGLGNLRVLRERLAIEESRLERYGTPTSMVILDVDKLKVLNDQHGHATGSEALKAIAGVLAKEVRNTDLAVRYGGDEFVALLPHTSLGEGLAFAGRVLRQIRELRPNGVKVSASLGVAAREEKSTGTFESLLADADAAVYQAKHGGGDQVCHYQPVTGTAFAGPVRSTTTKGGEAE
jgi:two-component system cell cycle response regulator